MHKIKYFSFAIFVLFLSSTLIAQVEKSVKETKVKVEKKIEKASSEIESAKDMVEAKSTNVKNACGPDSKMACCGSEAKEMKAEVMKKHEADCSCEKCTTVKAEIHKDHNMMKKAHTADCDCEGCAKT